MPCDLRQLHHGLVLSFWIVAGALALWALAALAIPGWRGRFARSPVSLEPAAEEA
jgi:hypothetical protein